jgi:hypothetical protein
VAIHYKVPTRNSSVPSVVAGAGIMPWARYFGFALGAESVHDLVLIEAGDTIVLGPGMVVPVGPWEGQPRVSCYRQLPHAPMPCPIHVIGLTECHELGIAPPRRAPFDAIVALEFGAGEPGVTVELPFGRRHALITATGPDTAVLHVEGYNPGQSLAQHEIALTPPGGITLTDNLAAVHIGGTDHEEPFPVLAVRLVNADAGTGEIHFTAYGEPGD